ncbi:hypothetical protein [Streptomyces mirabilis]|uniref:hypothetical protein n=2 Tax=Streptomyces TaxID=1883 RepID=UPI0037FE6D2E
MTFSVSLVPHPAEKDEEPYLFAKPPSSPSHRQRQNQHHVPGGSTTIKDMAALITWINASCLARHRPDRIPADRGRQPRLTTRQFRRTLTWFIARRPGGTIAGALQYRHQRIQMFEDSTVRQRRLRLPRRGRGRRRPRPRPVPRRDQRGWRPACTDRPPAGAEAEARLAEFARHAVFDGQVVTDEVRLGRIVARHDPHLHPGMFVTCVYPPERALCRTPSGPAETPVMADCQPLACRNAALTPANRQALADHLADLDNTLADGDRLAPYVRHRLEERRRETAAFLTRHTPEPTP